MGRYVNRYPYGAYSSRFYEKKERRRKIWRFIGWALLFSAQAAALVFMILTTLDSARYRVPAEEELSVVSGKVEDYGYVERRWGLPTIRYFYFVLENGEEYRLREPALDCFSRGLFEGQVQRGDEILLRVDKTKSLFHKEARVYEVWKGPICYLGYGESQRGYEWSKESEKQVSTVLAVLWPAVMIPLDILLWKKEQTEREKRK